LHHLWSTILRQSHAIASCTMCHHILTFTILTGAGVIRIEDRSGSQRRTPIFDVCCNLLSWIHLWRISCDCSCSTISDRACHLRHRIAMGYVSLIQGFYMPRILTIIKVSVLCPLQAAPATRVSMYSDSSLALSRVEFPLVGCWLLVVSHLSCAKHSHEGSL